MAPPLQLIHSQEVKHAPTVEQCRADQRLFDSMLKQHNGVGVANVSYKELDGWFAQLSHEGDSSVPYSE